MARFLALGAAVVLVALLAGCGGGSAKPTSSTYTKAKTRACLVGKHVRLGGKLDFVASTATGGALQAQFPDNFVTIAFGRTRADALNIDRAYVRFHSANVGIADVLRAQGNAIMLWHAHPSDADLSLVQGCLT